MNSSALDVITFGETMVCFAAHEVGPLEQAATFTKIVAGAESNVAVGLARLGLKVAWLSRLGDDSFGRYIRASLEAEGVDGRSITVDPAQRTGFMLKSRAPEGADPVHVIDSVHQGGKKIRFWAAPDNQNSWRRQMDLGVDLIGTDKIQELSSFLSKE